MLNEKFCHAAKQIFNRKSYTLQLLISLNKVDHHFIINWPVHAGVFDIHLGKEGSHIMIVNPKWYHGAMIRFSICDHAKI